MTNCKYLHIFSDFHNLSNGSNLTSNLFLITNYFAIIIMSTALSYCSTSFTATGQWADNSSQFLTLLRTYSGFPAQTNHFPYNYFSVRFQTVQIRSAFLGQGSSSAISNSHGYVGFLLYSTTVQPLPEMFTSLTGYMSLASLLNYECRYTVRRFFSFF